MTLGFNRRHYSPKFTGTANCNSNIYPSQLHKTTSLEYQPIE